MSAARHAAAHALVLTAIAVAGRSPVAAQTAPSWTALLAGPTTNGRYDDVKFVDARFGWVVSTGGEIWNTRDGGATWAQQIDTSDVSFRSAAFFDRGHGFAGTVFSGAQPLWETTDGGVTWRDATWRIIGPRPAGICGMWVVDAFVAVGVGAFHGSPVFLKTLNGGSEWLSRSMADVAATLVDVRFLDDRVGIAVGGTGERLNGNAVVVRTDDGGHTWRRVHETTRDPGTRGEWGWKITFPTPEVGYVSVEYATGGTVLPAKVLKTADAGLSWTELLIEGSLEPAGLQGIGFADAATGWASGRGTTSVTTDGGVTWTRIPPWNPEDGTGELDGSVNRFFFVGDSLAIAIGTRVYRLGAAGGASGVAARPALPFRIAAAWPNPSGGPTTLPVELDRAARVRIRVLDLLGRPVRTLVEETLSAGRHEIAWDGRSASGRPVAPGAYVVLYDIGRAAEMKQIIVMR